MPTLLLAGRHDWIPHVPCLERLAFLMPAAERVEALERARQRGRQHACSYSATFTAVPACSTTDPLRADGQRQRGKFGAILFVVGRARRSTWGLGNRDSPTPWGRSV